MDYLGLVGAKRILEAQFYIILIFQFLKVVWDSEQDLVQREMV